MMTMVEGSNANKATFWLDSFIESQVTGLPGPFDQKFNVLKVQQLEIPTYSASECLHQLLSFN